MLNFTAADSSSSWLFATCRPNWSSRHSPAGCNAKHHLEQRLARWLLITADRVHQTSFLMSQEFLADMVGNTRSTVSRVAGTLKDEGLIDYNRGVIHILNLKGLQDRACECYSIIKNHLDNYSDFDEDQTKETA